MGNLVISCYLYLQLETMQQEKIYFREAETHTNKQTHMHTHKYTRVHTHKHTHTNTQWLCSRKLLPVIFRICKVKKKKKKDKQWSGTDTIRSHILPSKPKGE